MTHIYHFCEKCKTYERAVYNPEKDTITCPKQEIPIKNSKTLQNSISYDSCEFSITDATDFISDSTGIPLLYFLLEGTPDDDPDSNMKRYENMPNVMFLPLRKSSGKGHKTFWQESDFDVFSKLCKEKLELYKKMNDKAKYKGFPENIGCNSKLPEKLKSWLETELSQI